MADYLDKEKIRQFKFGGRKKEKQKEDRRKKEKNGPTMMDYIKDALNLSPSTRKVFKYNPKYKDGDIVKKKPCHFTKISILLKKKKK